MIDKTDEIKLRIFSTKSKSRHEIKFLSEWESTWQKKKNALALSVSRQNDF